MTRSDDDIVTELRDWAHVTNEVQGKATLALLSGDVFTDAADEISRLRDLVHRWKNAAEAYERGSLGTGDRLIEEARKGNQP